MTARGDAPPEDRPLFAADRFPEVTPAEWRARVERELGAEGSATALTGRLPGGLEVEPLYTERPWGEGRDPRGVPGWAPYVRGGRPAAAARTWRRCALCAPGPRPSAARLEAAAAALAEDLEGGCDGVLLTLAAPEPLDRLLAAVRAPETAVFLDDLGAGPAVAAALLDRRDESGAAAGAPVLGLGVDPLSALAGGALEERGDGGGFLEAVAGDLAALTARCRAHGERARVATVSTVPLHEAGAHPALELGWAAAALAHTLRCGDRHGVAPAETAGRVELRISLERDTFAGIAKLRAVRELWGRLLVACGVEEPPAPFVHALCSQRSLTARGARLNLVRVATQTLAAVAGGADAVSPAPWDAVLAEAAAGGGSRSGRRLARNTLTILTEEAHLDRGADPGGGAYYVESLTERLARAGWQEMRRIEAAGGAAEHLLSGGLRADVDAAWASRAAAVRGGELPIVGVTDFPDPDETEVGAAARRPGGEAPAAAITLPRRRDEGAVEEGP